MGLEKFNPANKQYKRVEDLPEENRSGFKNTDNGGFVTREAAYIFEQAKDKAKEENKKRSILEKITGQKKVSGTDLLQEEATKENTTFENKREEKKEEEQHLYYMLVNNVSLREIFLLLQGDNWNFLLKRKQGHIETTLEPDLRNKINFLLENGNDLAKTEREYNLKYSEGGFFSYEEDRDVFESLHNEIIEEEKRAALREELRKRHPQNPLFKTRWLTAPEDIEEGVEDKKTFVSVFCATNEEGLDRIGQEGLKFAGEERMNGEEMTRVEKTNTAKMKLEKIFKEVAPVGYNRRLSVFAVPEYRDPDRSEAMGGMGKVVLEIMVNADHAMVFDVERYNHLAESMHLSGSSLSDPKFLEEALTVAKDYWNNGMLLSEYLKLSLAEQKKRFSTPEILIPDTVSPEQIKVVSVIEE